MQRGHAAVGAELLLAVVAKVEALHEHHRNKTSLSRNPAAAPARNAQAKAILRQRERKRLT